MEPLTASAMKLCGRLRLREETLAENIQSNMSCTYKHLLSILSLLSPGSADTEQSQHAPGIVSTQQLFLRWPELKPHSLPRQKNVSVPVEALWNLSER